MRHNLGENMQDDVGVYIIHNKDTDQTYVGSGNLKSRYKMHEYLLRNDRHWNHQLQGAYNANQNFDFVGVDVYSADREEAFDIEQCLVDEHWDSGLLLNLAKDVRTPRFGAEHTEESKEKMRMATTLKWEDPAHREKVIAAQAAGKAAMSEEARNSRAEKIGESLKVLYETGQRVSTKGQTRSDEFKQQNSSNIKNLWSNPEYRAKQMAARAASREK